MLNKSFRAVVTATAAAGVALTAFGDRYLLIITILGFTWLFAAGWAELLGLPARLGTSILLIFSAAAGVYLQVVTGDLAYVAASFGVVVALAFVHQMLRRDGRPRLMESVAGSVSGAVVVLSGVGWLAIGTGPVSVGLMLVGAVTLAVAAIGAAIPIPQPWGAILTIAVAAGAGAGAGYAIVSVGPITAAIVGLCAGLLTAVVHHVLGQFPASVRTLPAIASALLPVLVCGVPVYVLGRVLLLL